MSWVIGLAGIISGLIVVTRRITRHWLDEVVVFELLGVVILLTGVLHIVGEFRVGQWTTRRATRVQFLLGVFEVVLGAMLLISPLDRGPITYWTATLWALLFGGLTLGTTLRDRVRAPRQDEESGQQPETDSVTTK